MRTPEHRAQPRAGKRFEAELDMNYLSPGAFTVLPLDVNRLPDPPSAPAPYRLPPTTRSHRHQSFAILGELSSSPNSRSSSPSGRVSPFKGHGFNPTGSRHASPSVSPIPPEDPRNKPKNVSRIPKLAPQHRKSSADSIFGDKVQHVTWGLNRQTSQSLTSLEEKQMKRPPIPRKRLKASIIKQLSPIQGSSPEPSQSLSSPSRIPTSKSKSTPASRLASPTRAPSRSQSKPNMTVQPKIPLNRYQHVQSRINSFNKARPTKPSSSDLSEDSESPRKRVQRKNSLKRTSSRPNLLPKTFMGGKYIKNTSDSSDTVDTKTFGSKVNDVIDSGHTKPIKYLAKVNNKVVKNNNSKSDKTVVNNTKDSVKTEDTQTLAPKTKDVERPIVEKVDPTPVVTSTTITMATTTTETTLTDSSASESKPAKLTKKTSKNDLTKMVKPPLTSSDDNLPSAMEVVTSTTATVTKPLKIDTPKLNRSVSPLIDGRVLSATSVSQAINKMNDTVLNTQTLIKDSGLQSKLSPTPGSMFVKNNEQPVKKPETAKVNTPPATSQAQNNGKLVTSQANNNHIGLAAEVPKLSANDRIREARTVIAADVKPIRILVKEKPTEVEVQSGNVPPHLAIMANGTSERPSLPPTERQQQPPPPVEPTKNEPLPNRCKKFLENCTKVLTCNSCQKCRRAAKVREEVKEARQEEEVKPGCLQCLRKKDRKKLGDQVRISIEDENGEEQKTKLWQNLNCCKKNKVSDSKSCFPIGKRKQTWVERRASIFNESEIQQKTKCCSKEGCKSFFRKMFCCCCKKKEDELRPPPLSSRKESVVSNKKKSLTPLSAPPPEDLTPKIDASLVEHTSQMKGAIPVLPVWLAWFCCVMNCIGPGTGTVLSGLFCLCIGKPRFSQKDGPKPRIGAFIIDLIIGFSQFFTVLFCLVGWGWSIWWGVIMVKIAKKHRKLRNLEKMEENAVKPENQRRDVERGRT